MTPLPQIPRVGGPVCPQPPQNWTPKAGSDKGDPTASPGEDCPDGGHRPHRRWVSRGVTPPPFPPPRSQQDAAPASLSMEAVVADLRPLMLWLANAMELLNLAQGRVLELEKELELEGEPLAPPGGGQGVVSPPGFEG